MEVSSEVANQPPSVAQPASFGGAGSTPTVTEDLLNGFLASIEPTNTAADVAGVLLQEANAPSSPSALPPAAAAAPSAVAPPALAGGMLLRTPPQQKRPRVAASFVEESDEVSSPASQTGGASGDVGDFLNSFVDRYGSRSPSPTEPVAPKAAFPFAEAEESGADSGRPGGDGGDIDALLGAFSK